MSVFAVGSMVRTQYKYYGRRRLGVVESRDGGNVMVRLNYKNILIHVYDCEIESLSSSALARQHA